MGYVSEWVWSVNIRDWVFVFGVGCSFRGWAVCIWVGVLVNGIEC